MSNYINLKEDECLLKNNYIHFSFNQISILKTFGFITPNVKLSTSSLDDTTFYFYKVHRTKSTTCDFINSTTLYTHYYFNEYNPIKTFLPEILNKRNVKKNNHTDLVIRYYKKAKFSIVKQNISTRKSTYVLKLSIIN